MFNPIPVALRYLQSSFEFRKAFPNWNPSWGEILYLEYRLLKCGYGAEQKKEADAEAEAY